MKLTGAKPAPQNTLLRHDEGVFCRRQRNLRPASCPARAQPFLTRHRKKPDATRSLGRHSPRGAGQVHWQVVAVSQTDELLNAEVVNLVMAVAYRAGIPGNGKPFPCGSKIAKIECPCTGLRCGGAGGWQTGQLRRRDRPVAVRRQRRHCRAVREMDAGCGWDVAVHGPHAGRRGMALRTKLLTMVQ